MDPKFFDDIAKRIADSMPPGVKAFQNDVENNVRAGLEGVFNRLNLVTREEFDVQVAALAKLRLQVEMLEARVAELEAKPSKPIKSTTKKTGSTGSKT